MKTEILNSIETFTFIQNIENNSEYFAHGKLFNFIEGLETEKVLTEEEFKTQSSKWMFDELIIYRLPLNDKIQPELLFYYCNLLSSENKEAWKEHYKNMNIQNEVLSDFDFEDIFGWGINEWLFDHSPVSLQIDFNAIQNKCQLLDTTNPLFLYGEFEGYQYLFNYNGYT